MSLSLLWGDGGLSVPNPVSIEQDDFFSPLEKEDISEEKTG